MAYNMLTGTVMISDRRIKEFRTKAERLRFKFHDYDRDHGYCFARKDRADKAHGEASTIIYLLRHSTGDEQGRNIEVNAYSEVVWPTGNKVAPTLTWLFSIKDLEQQNGKKELWSYT